MSLRYYYTLDFRLWTQRGGLIGRMQASFVEGQKFAPQNGVQHGYWSLRSLAPDAVAESLEHSSRVQGIVVRTHGRLKPVTNKN